MLAIAAIGLLSRQADTPSYETQSAKFGDLTVNISATGSLQPTKQVDVSSELSGIVREVDADYNSVVSPGEVLAVLDTNKLEADVKSAQANLESATANVLKAKAQVKQADAALSRQKSLRKGNASTQQNLDDAQFNYDAAMATLEGNQAETLVAEANLRLAQVDLGKAKIVSPIEGIVLTRSVNPGATVAASFSAPVLFTIAGDLRKMELRVDVDEADMGQIANGQRANFTVEAYPDRTFPAEIKQIRFASDTTNNVVTYKAILTVENPDLVLRPGMTATANIVARSIKHALLVPSAALRFIPPSAMKTSTSQISFFDGSSEPAKSSGSEPVTGNKRRLWVLRDGKPSPVTVDIGASDGMRTQVISGDLHEGDAVIFDLAGKKS
ncbi:efflux RND transporter periplasmic adaptor subunit [Rhizobium lusitanum]|uniref:Efflux RND transporter periplasmic adaptor subunit n=2 Tax=Rhizobium lusitanum TaxID=293958 RepID=A0A6L9UEX7_9HYPH|nr:efflux RND transporter periplasmic adaptor subunit [Rhizobium lusitanum]